ncbi:uncharacterized protein K02A2.6-like [Penaeus indicus]|uniref:uncharacterized protein K02A2.6-like n=1 Tax=Penaeus indicus TaxID=29960 RepID=UPI00300D7F8A
MGLVNQLSEFTPDIASVAQTLRPLLSPKRTFNFTADHDEAFKRVTSGIGYALLQDHGQGRLHLVQFGSRFLTDAETCYTTIELELLAAVWATSKCKPYLIGVLNFTLMTDHRPLISILNKYTLDAVEKPRLQCLKVNKPAPEDEKLCSHTDTHLWSIVTLNAISTITDSKNQDADRTLQELREAATADPTYCRLKNCVITRFPSNRYDLHNSLIPYWKLRDSLSADGELVLYGQRIVIPTDHRRHTFARLHDSHRGVEATKRRARQTVYWPGIDADIISTVQACQPCQVMQPSQQQETIQNDNNPTKPFESVSADFFTVAGKSFLVIADRLSGWPIIVPCGASSAASRTTRMFCYYFRDVGVPLRLRTDGGPQFTSYEFQEFMKRWGVHHVVSSPHYPQSDTPRQPSSQQSTSS